MEKKFDLIEKYLLHEMSVGEIKKFEKLLQNDADLRKELLLRKKIDLAIAENDIMELRESLNDITSVKIGSNQISFIERRKIFLSIAATIIIIISLSLSFLFPFSQSSDKIFDLYYTTYPALANIRSIDNNEQSESYINRAFESYENKNFKSASEDFKKALNIDDRNFIAQFYFALCELEENNLKESEKYFTFLIQNNDHLFWEQSHWYLAMLYLKQDNKEKVKIICEKIIAQEMVYTTKAKKILRKLD